MKRSQKISRFFGTRAQIKEQLSICIQQAQASKQLIFEYESIEDGLVPSYELATSFRDIEVQDNMRVDYLQRQLFALDNPKIEFSVEKSDLRIATMTFSRCLSRVIFSSEEDEMLYMLTWTGRKITN